MCIQNYCFLTCITFSLIFFFLLFSLIFLYYYYAINIFEHKSNHSLGRVSRSRTIISKVMIIWRLLICNAIKHFIKEYKFTCWPKQFEWLMECTFKNTKLSFIFKIWYTSMVFSYFNLNLFISRASLVAQLLKNLPALRKTWV